MRVRPDLPLTVAFGGEVDFRRAAGSNVRPWKLRVERAMEAEKAPIEEQAFSLVSTALRPRISEVLLMCHDSLGVHTALLQIIYSTMQENCGAIKDHLRCTGNRVFIKSQ